MTTYFIDQERMEEMGRLALQDGLLTHAMGGLLPERRNDFTGLTAVLDVACGSGTWCLEVARQYPAMQVTGVDLSESMIAFNQAQAKAYERPNVTFALMDVTQPLAFADASFDLVNARFLHGFLTPETWRSLLAECRRLLRPGGIIRITECENAITSGAACTQLGAILTKGMYAQGRTCSSVQFGTTALLGPFLRQAGFQQVQTHAYALDCSFGTPLHQPLCEDFAQAMQLTRPFFLHLGVASRRFNALVRRMYQEMDSEAFYGIWYVTTFTGVKPAEERSEKKDKEGR